MRNKTRKHNKTYKKIRASELNAGLYSFMRSRNLWNFTFEQKKKKQNQKISLFALTNIKTEQIDEVSGNTN